MATKKRRDFRQEKATARKRGETDSGSTDARGRSTSGDAKRNRDRRAHESKTGRKISLGKELHHTGRNGSGPTKVISKKANRADGGRKGDRKGKAAGGAKGNRAGKALGGRNSSRRGIKNKK